MYLSISYICHSICQLKPYYFLFMDLHLTLVDHTTYLLFPDFLYCIFVLQAYVRSLISTDEEGEDLYRGLGDKEDTSVDTMVALIDDDYPFEHNTWSGGVKADDVKLKKGHAQTSESSDENVPDPVEKDNAHRGGVESGGYPGDPRGQSSANPSGAPHGGESFHVDVETLLRRAADVYEDKVIAMFEGYILSLKGHFNSEVGGLRTDLQAATSAIAHLETKVTWEFDKINQLLKTGLRGADMGATYGFSPGRHSSPFPGQNDDFNYTEVNPDRHTTHTGVPEVNLNTMKLLFYSITFH